MLIEKMNGSGASGLTDAELLALLIGKGNKKQSSIEIATVLLQKNRQKLTELARRSVRELAKTPGIGPSRATLIHAALEIGRRRMAGEHLSSDMVTGSEQVGRYLQAKLMDLSHEVFGVLYLNRANRIRSFEIISSGGITGTVADPRIILKKALEEDAVSIILCHNHPSGNLRPSRADEEITHKIRAAARFFDIQVLDHIIVSTDGYYSFADEGFF